MRGRGARSQAAAAQGLHPGCQIGPAFDKLWQLVEYLPEGATQYLEGLLARLHELTAKRTKAQLPPEISANSLLCTIQFVGLFFKFKPSKKMTTMLKDIASAGGAGGGGGGPSAAELSQGLSQAVRPVLMRLGSLGPTGTSGAMEGLLRTLVSWCSTQGDPGEFNRMASYTQYPTLDTSSKLRGEHSFLWSFLQERAARSPNHLSIIMGEAVKWLCALPQIMKMNPRVAETSLLSYLQLMSSLMPLAGALTARQLGQAIQDLQQFYFWPKPYGEAARDLLIQLEQELLVPGAALRVLIETEARCARTRVPMGPDKSRPPVVFHVIDAVSAKTREFCHIMKIRTVDLKVTNRNRLKVGEVDSLTTLRILAHTVNQEIPLKRADIDVLLMLGEAQVKTIHESLKSALGQEMAARAREGKGLSPKNAAARRHEFLKTLKRSWEGLVRARPEDDPSVGRHFSQDSVSDLYQLVEERRGALRGPMLVHRYVASALRYSMSSAEQRRLAREKRVLPPEPDMYETLKEVLDDRLRNGATASNRLLVRVCLSGGDRILHSFLCALVRLMSSDPAVAMTVDFSLFIVPFERNHLAAFMARHDAWYARHIYTPFWSSHFLLPWVQFKLEDESDTKTGVRGGVMGRPTRAAPGGGPKKGKNLLDSLEPTRMSKYFTGLVDSYVRHGRAKLPIAVWSCLVFEERPEWDHKSDSKDAIAETVSGGAIARAVISEPSQSLPFLQRVEIGYKAELARAVAAASGEAGDGTALADTTQTPRNPAHRKRFEDKFVKDRKFQPPEVKIRFTQVGFDGKVRNVVREHGYQTFQELVVSNVPWNEDVGRTSPSHPSDPWLEMHTRAVAVSGSKKGAILVQEPDQHISRLEIMVRGDERLCVLVDGQLFPQPTRGGSLASRSQSATRGYRCIVIEKCVHKGEQLRFPVQTFFPITQ